MCRHGRIVAVTIQMSFGPSQRRRKQVFAELRAQQTGHFVERALERIGVFEATMRGKKSRACPPVQNIQRRHPGTREIGVDTTGQIIVFYCHVCPVLVSEHTNCMLLIIAYNMLRFQRWMNCGKHKGIGRDFKSSPSYNRVNPLRLV